MLVSRQLPDPNEVASDQRDQPLQVIEASLSNSYYHPEHESPFGILCMLNGSGDYFVNQRHYSINDRYYFVLNEGSQVEIEIPGQQRSNPFFLFFGKSLFNEIHSFAANSTTALLDDPFKKDHQHALVEGLNRHDAVTISQIRNLRNCINFQSDSEAAAYALCNNILSKNTNKQIEIDRLEVIKKSTRNELYYRLYKAKYFIEDCYFQQLTLNDISQHATLNSFHLLRMFKQLFKQTPHQYLISRRLEMAKHFLLTSDKAVSEIVTEVGFESHASFTRLFKERFGLAPRNIRNK